MEEGLKTADPHDFSTYTGWTGASAAHLLPVLTSTWAWASLSYAGIALLYLRLHQVSQEALHLQRALEYVKRATRVLNGRKVSFLCGDAGPLAVGAVVHHKLKNEAESRDCLSRWVCDGVGQMCVAWIWPPCVADSCSCSVLCWAQIRTFPMSCCTDGLDTSTPCCTWTKS